MIADETVATTEEEVFLYNQLIASDQPYILQKWRCR